MMFNAALLALTRRASTLGSKPEGRLSPRKR